MADALVTTDIYIAAPPGRVFAVATDLRGAKARLSGVAAIEIIAEEPKGAGTRWRETRLVFGVPIVQEMTVESVDPPNGFVVSAAQNGATSQTRFSFMAEPGGTRVRVTFTIPPANYMAVLFTPALFLLPGIVKGILDQDLADLKAAAEAA